MWLFWFSLKRNREKKIKVQQKFHWFLMFRFFSFNFFFQMLSSGCHLIDNKKWLERWHNTIVNTIPSLNDNNIIETKERKITQIYWSSNKIHDTNMYQEIHHTLKLADSGQYEQKTTAKICTCNKCHNNTHDICFYIPFCTIFVCLGIIQIIAGIFYFITIPVIKLIFNVVIGCWVRYITSYLFSRKRRKLKLFWYFFSLFTGHFMWN